MPGSVLDSEWHRMEGSEFNEVLWTYAKNPTVVCNGINVGTSASSMGYHRFINWSGEGKQTSMMIPLKAPRVSVCDFAGAFPLELTRFGMVRHKFPFASILSADVARDYCAFCLVFTPKGPEDFWRSPTNTPHYPGWNEFFRQQSFFSAPWLFTTEGAVPFHTTNLRRYSPAEMIVMLSTSEERSHVVGMTPGAAYCFAYTSEQMKRVPMSLMHLFGQEFPGIGKHLYFFDKSNSAFALMHYSGDQRGPINTTGLPDVQVTLVDIPDNQRRGIDESVRSVLMLWQGYSEAPIKEIPWGHLNVIASGTVIYVKLTNPSMSFDWCEPEFTTIWNHFMISPVIPYDEKHKRKQFSIAFEGLEKFIKKWETIKAGGLVEFSRLFYTEPGRPEEY